MRYARCATTVSGARGKARIHGQGRGVQDGAESSVANPHHSKRNGCALLAVSSLRMSRSLNGQVPFASVSEFTGALRGWALPT